MERIIFHIDVNNAFLSWTAIDLLNKGYKYDIRNSYAVIGGDEEARHGIVLAKSNAAKKMGIKTADTLYSARKKCPALRVYPSNYSFYAKMSKKLFELLSKYSPEMTAEEKNELLSTIIKKIIYKKDRGGRYLKENFSIDIILLPLE